MNIERIESIQEQPVILEQPAFWTRALIWLIVAITTSGVVWASLAKMDQSIPAQGRLEPEGSLREVKVPTGGMVREVHVAGGDRVNEGDLLVTLDSTVSRASVESLREARDQRRSEARAFQAQAEGLDLGILDGIGEFDRTQIQRVQARRAELASQEDATNSRIRQLETQITQTQGQIFALDAQISSLESRLGIAEDGRNSDRQQLATSEDRLRESRQRLERSRLVLEEDRNILADLEPLLEDGGIARLQVTRQRQQVMNREQEVSSAQDDILARQSEITQIRDTQRQRESEIEGLQSEILARRAEQDRLRGELGRLQEGINEAQAQLRTVRASSEREAYQAISENQRQDTQLTSQLAAAEQELRFTELRSPIDGVVFEVLPNFGQNEETGSSGFVLNTTEPVITIVPNTRLIANVFVTNNDIGFITTGMEVEVQINAFPAMEFGTIPGTLTSIGQDVLEPDQNRPFYAFPVTIELEDQHFDLPNSDMRVPLQSGMAVEASIKVRERTVMSLFLDRFTGSARTLEHLR
ncbi:MAG: HlyD family efflux transporter periplasmic adaptor subunit [Phormidium sp. BM_Day4_Bin.17]|nr:HlyD family efflux transporter periplasmic adaptor subunit [Phormidium sp. BM_Day4_Bin.17]UCJ13136.1 MAG: HlyD family efflux transporter periplasmic adaptor subunit [Phormidium sp. PBR-2020]